MAKGKYADGQRLKFLLEWRATVQETGSWSIVRDWAGSVLGEDSDAMSAIDNAMADKGIQPQPVELEPAHQRAIDALHVVKRFLDNLESRSADDDPLKAMRKRFHAPLHAAIDGALVQSEGGSNENEMHSKNG